MCGSEAHFEQKLWREIEFNCMPRKLPTNDFKDD
jgi:hypothetical protein